MRRSIQSRKALLIALLGLTGCTPTHLRANAPGNVDVRTPPEHIDKREFERPDDPGEHRLALTFGALTGGGFTLRGEDDDAASGAVSLEVSVHYQRADRSHDDDMAFPVPGFYPMRALGVNLGYLPITSSRDFDLGVVGPFYLELQYSDLWWAAGGWQADFERKRHGPQLTGGLGPFYLRVVHLADTETQFEFGLVLKGFHVWTWSR